MELVPHLDPGQVVEGQQRVWNFRFADRFQLQVGGEGLEVVAEELADVDPLGRHGEPGGGESLPERKENYFNIY